MNKAVGVLCVVLISLAAQTQSKQNPPAGEKPAAKAEVPVIDGGIGPCYLELTVLGVDTKPVYNATVKVHITYGFGGFHHLDLQAGTNLEGKGECIGKACYGDNPPPQFHAAH